MVQSEALPLTEAQIEKRQLVAEKHAQARDLMRKQGIDCWLTFSREGSDLLLPFVMGAEYLVGQAALSALRDTHRERSITLLPGDSLTATTTVPHWCSVSTAAKKFRRNSLITEGALPNGA